MSENDKVDPYYMRQATDLTNMLFDKRFLADDLSRESVMWLEDYFAFLFQSQCESAVKITLLTKKVRDTK